MAGSENAFGSSDSLNKLGSHGLDSPSLLNCPTTIRQLQQLANNSLSSSVEPATISDSRDQFDALVCLKTKTKKFFKGLF
jgi:hypothetical protein